MLCGTGALRGRYGLCQVRGSEGIIIDLAEQIAGGRGGFQRPALIETMPAIIIINAPIFPGVIGSLKKSRDHTMAQT